MLNRIYNTSSGTIFFISLFTILLGTILQFGEIYYLFIFISILCIYLPRVINRWKKIKNQVYIIVEDSSFSVDSKARAQLILDCLNILILGLFLFAFCYEPLFLELGNNLFFIYIIFSILYFFIASLSISTNKIYFKVINIFSSTLQGLIFIMLLILIFLVSIQSVISGQGIKMILNMIDQLTAIPKIEIVVFSYIIESYLKEYLFLMFFSLCLFIIIILLTPAYQIDNLSEAFKISNILIFIFGILVFYFAHSIIGDISSLKSSFENDNYKESFLYPEIYTELKNYISSFTKANIINLGYILLLPYTLGILISNFLIDYKKRRFKSKSNAILDRYLTLPINETIEEEKLYKKYLFYSGDKHIWRLTLESKYKKENLNE